ncbi:MAG: HEPN domain-containing protein [Planctomycetota bacterium]
MTLPHDAGARRFYRVAVSRLSDAKILLRHGGTTNGAMYLAGFGVECMLKALALERTPPSGRQSVMESFRGTRGHDLGWLKSRCPMPAFSAEVRRAFVRVSTWSTDLRYDARHKKRHEAELFLAAAESVVTFVEGEL